MGSSHTWRAEERTALHPGGCYCSMQRLHLQRGGSVDAEIDGLVEVQNPTWAHHSADWLLQGGAWQGVGLEEVRALR